MAAPTLGTITTNLMTSASTSSTISGHVVDNNGDYLVVMLGGRAGLVTSVVWDVAGVNTALTQVYDDVTASVSCAIFVGFITTGATKDITITHNNLQFAETAVSWAGVDTGTPYSELTSATGNTDALSLTGFTASADNTLCAGWAQINGTTLTANTGTALHSTLNPSNGAAWFTSYRNNATAIATDSNFVRDSNYAAIRLNGASGGASTILPMRIRR